MQTPAPHSRPPPRPARRRKSPLLIASGLGLSAVGLAALGAVHLMLATPWPLDPVFAGRAVQLDFLLVWGGFAALVAGLEMIVAGLWGVPWRRRASLAPETSNPSNGEA